MTKHDASTYLDKVRSYVPNSLYMAAGLGLGGALLGSGLWRNAVNTGGSLGRYPLKKMLGMTDDEYDEAVEELASDSRYKYVIPAALGTLLAGGYLGFKYNKNQQGKGLTSWTPKTASLHKEADELFSYGGYVPPIDFGKIINANQAKSLFTNDPHLKDDPYVRNMGLSIINDASRNAGYVNPTLGNIYDSTAKKVKSKLSWEGVTGIAANTMLANATAHLFTGALGAVMPLSDQAKRNIIDAGTWGAFATSIFT